MEKKTGTYKSLDGKKFKVTGFTRMMAIRVEEAVNTSWELEEKRPLPKRPTYKLEGEDVFGGDEVIYYHTEETLYEPQSDEDKGKERKYLAEITDEEKKAWENYQQTKNELSTRVWKQMMYEAMNCVVVPMKDLQEYVSIKRRDTGIFLPDPKEYEARVKRIYVEEIVLCDDTDEMMRLLTETMRVAGVINDEEAAKAMESFLDQEAEQSSKPAKRPDTSEPVSNS